MKAIYFLSIILLASFACSTSNDLFNAASKHSTSSSSTSVQYPVIQDQTIPGLFFEMSKEFIVGKGIGKDIEQARDNAIDDIKRQIVQAAGEKIIIMERSSQGNVIRGRSKTSSSNDFYSYTEFISDLDLPISFDFENIDQVFYNGKPGSYNYFIRYNVPLGFIEKILQAYNQKWIDFENYIEDITTYNQLSFVEELIVRKKTISELVLDPPKLLSSLQKLKLKAAINDIDNIIKNLRFEEVYHKNKKFSIALKSMGRFYAFTTMPSISMDPHIGIENMEFVNDALWISYKHLDYVEHPEPFNIKLLVYDHIIDPLQITPQNYSKPLVKEINMKQIELKIISISSWSDIVREIELTLNFETNASSFSVKKAEIILQSPFNQNITLTTDTFEPLNQPPDKEAKLIFTTDCKFPRKYLTTISNAEVMLIYGFEDDSSCQNQIFHNVPVKLKP